MNSIYRYILAIIILLVGFNAYSSEISSVSDLPVVQLLGEDYYVYTTKKNESLFGVSRKFGWDDKLLTSLNPSAVSPFKKGMKLYYPVSTAKSSKSAQDRQSANNKIPSSDVRHTVKRGETVYSISSVYGVPVERIYELNPDSRNGITSGQSLLISKSSGESELPNVEKEIVYTVKPGDNLLQLSKDYGVSVAAILKQNPGLKESELVAGSNIKIPVRGSGIRKTVKEVSESNLNSVELAEVGKDETWQSLASRTGVPTEVLKEANPNITDLKNKSFVGVPRIDVSTEQKEVETIDTRESTPEGLTEIYEDIHKINNDSSTYTVRVAIVVSNIQNKRDIEYVRGFLTGVDRNKLEDYHIDVKVIDGANGSESVINQLDQFKPAIVFLTSDNDIPSYISEYAEISRTPVVNTFDTRSTAYTENPYIIQLLTPSTLFNENVAYYTNKKYGDRKIVFVGERDSKDQLAEALMQIWEPNRILSISMNELETSFFDESGKYLVYLYPVNKDEIKDAVSKVYEAASERPFAEINVLGRPNLIQYEETMTGEFQKARVSIPSRFYIQKDSENYSSFVNRYKSLYNRTPVKSLPLYAAVGYDTSIYFIPALANSRGDINSLQPSSGTVQNNFNLWRTSNWSGFLNPPVFMVNFTPYGTVEKQVIDITE